MKISVSQQQYDQIKQVVDDVTVKFIQDLPALLQNRLEKAVASMLGFEPGQWSSEGKWTIRDHSSKSTLISGFINSRATAEARKIVENLTFKAEPEQEEVMKLAFQKEFESVLRNKIHEAAQQKVKAILDKVLAEVDKLDVIDLNPTVAQASNPTFGRTALEKMALKRLLRDTKLMEGFTEDDIRDLRLH